MFYSDNANEEAIQG